VEVLKLTRLAYPDLQPPDQEEMALETFLQTLDRPVKRHLLASPAHTIAEAILKAEEFLQVGESSHTKVTAIQEEAPPSEITLLHQALSNIQQLMEAQTELLKKVTERKTLRCFECGGPHRKRFCPRLQKNTETTTQGNE